MKNMKVYCTETQSVELVPLKADDFILDIGGGGEGIIGKLNGKQVVAIDTSLEELQETRNDALKVVMDAADLKFLSKSFSLCTSFFSLMYIPRQKHLRVFREVYRVLKDEGRFLVWDVRIPEKHGDYDVFAVRLKVQLPNEEVQTEYGMKWDKSQNIEYFKRLAQKTKFKVINDWCKDEIFYLEMRKES